ncbi:MAG TPA: site-2 protease family protein [archaeon]|nr:site-2 protease family protein [archaeon]
MANFPIPTDFESLSTIAFLILLVILAIRDRKNIEFKYGVLIRRMHKGKEWIYKVGDAHKTFFSIFGYAALVVGIIASLGSFYLIIQSGYSILANPDQARPGLQPIIPSVPSTTICSYALCVPFWYWIIGVLIVLLSHELAHAFVSRAENIKIKSFGLLSLVVLPGAFVEPDERQLKKSSSMTKLKIYAAGSFANILIFALATVISMAIFQTFYIQSGVSYESLVDSSPAMAASLKGVIVEINDQKIHNTDDFRAVMGNVRPGQFAVIKTTEGEFRFATAASPDKPDQSYIGIANPFTFFSVTSQAGVFSGSIEWFYRLFVWVAFLNIGIGLVNLLPIKPLDGGLVYEEIFKVIFKKNMPSLVNGLSIITFAIILINILGPYVL